VTPDDHKHHIPASMATAPRCTCPRQYDERTGGTVLAGTDQFCQLHGSRREHVPHCPTCTCGVGSKIVQEPRQPEEKS
jgi:hypothetical protein